MTDTTCSSFTHEPLPGTAKTGTLFIALEHHYGWSHDILDGGVFGDDTTSRLKAWLKERGAVLQFIRKPGRLGQIDCDGVNLFISHCVPGSIALDANTTRNTAPSTSPNGVYLEHRIVADVEELMTLDIQLGKKTAEASEVAHPLLLVCTHGKRDRCCAVKGRPVAATLNNVYPDAVWETSHSKGHRFAPALVLLPWNVSYGRLSALETKAVIDDALAGKIHPQGYRGRGIYAAPAQVAEIAVRTETANWNANAIADVEVSGTRAVVTLYDEHNPPAGPGPKYEVTLEQIVTEDVVSSCGDAPGPKKGWAARGVRSL